jgi:hypothetical protein
MIHGDASDIGKPKKQTELPFGFASIAKYNHTSITGK